MLARLRKAKENGESGFTLIELLVVMIIIGILAAIAIPAFLNQRDKAAETAAKSDATNVSKEVAAALVDGNLFNLDLTAATLPEYTLSWETAVGGADSSTVKGSADVTLTITGAAVTATDATGASDAYCVVAVPSRASAATWSANADGLFKSATCS